MGNSEVGHLNLGAGRIVYQDLTRIDQAVRDGSLEQNPVWGAALDRARGSGTLHLIGLLSPGGVHSHERHLAAMIRHAIARGVKRIRVHAFLDGRDTPRSAMPSIRAAGPCSAKPRRADRTVSGRTTPWTGQALGPEAYRALVDGTGTRVPRRRRPIKLRARESDEFVDDGRTRCGRIHSTATRSSRSTSA
jgi:bisphosphoglycerate-independent phosphoglycerate mutase (AlkP superfamily)